MQTAEISIKVAKRAPFDDVIAVMGYDYSAAAFAMDIRNEPGDQGDALASLATTVAPAQGISCSYDPDYADPEGDGPAGASLIRIRVNETTNENLPYASDPAADKRFHYDLHVTPDGGKKFVFCAGAYIVSPGVTL